MAELESERPAEAVIETRSDAGVPVVAVSGEIDMSNVGALESTVEQIAAQGPGRLIFDLRGLRFMDSAGIAVLLNAASKVETVEVHDPSPPVRRVVELTGLTRVLALSP